MDRPAHPASLFDRWTLLTLLCVAAYMIWGASRHTVFDDEAWSCRLYALPIGAMLGELWRGADPDPPLFYVLQNAWVHIFDVGPLALRTLPILFFLGGLVAMRAAGRAWFGPRTGLVTLLICALHPAHLLFGLAARWYSLMFLTVGLLLWATAALTNGARDRADREGATSRFKPIALWAVAAAAVCYTNYFGLVVVGLIWTAGLLRQPRAAGGRKRFMLPLILAFALAAAWFPPLLSQLSAFDRPPATPRAFAATAVRTGAALLTGNLAAPSAWWVWLPAAVFLVAFVVLLARKWLSVRPIALVVLGCLAAGVASRTMIDKYVMTFSGPACLLVAALLVTKASNQPNRLSAALRRICAVALAAAWLGCGVNLVRERHWSSLRWLDRFETVTADLLRESDERGDRMIVTSHPTARYYFALHAARSGDLGAARSGPEHHKPAAQRWRSAFESQASDNSPSHVATPVAAIPRLQRTVDAADTALPTPQLEVTTLETAGYVDPPYWQALLDLLNSHASFVQEIKYGEDAHAEWKDWLDPAVGHPSHRIIVRRWLIDLPGAPDAAPPIP